MHKHIASFKNFIYTQYFYDGIKITIGVLLPSLIFFQFDNLLVGLPLSLGALCVSVADNPGPNTHKRNAMILTACFIFLISILTGLLNSNPYFLGIEIVILSFVFSIFHIYGDRAAAVGTATLLIMIFNTDQVRPYQEVWQHALLVLGGGIWYLMLSLIFVQLRPNRYAQQSLGECVQEIAKYLKNKADFFDYSITVANVFKNLVNQQVTVNELQENVREILFNTHKNQNTTSASNRLLVVIFIDMVDVFEQTTASHYDYNVIRKQFNSLQILSDFQLIIKKLAAEIKYLGICLMHNQKPGRHLLSLSDLDNVKKKLDELEASGVTVLVLKKILINIRNIFNKVDDIYKYYQTPNENYIDKDRASEFTKFVHHQDYNVTLLKNNLTLQSSYFRHALRVSLVMGSGFLVAKLLPIGHHSYWILLTIVVILKPGFSLSKQRNYERVIGTIIGGIAGVLILIIIKNQTILFSLLLVFMVLTYSFQRLKYVVSVLFMTPFILILFNFIGVQSNINVATERVIDTLIGSLIAFLSSYLLFPSWESFKFKQVLANMVKANLNYFNIITNKMAGDVVATTSYKLARKEVYVNTANLGAAFKRMLNEPKNKQHKTNEVQKFVVLNHILTSYLANLSLSTQQSQNSLHTNELKTIKKVFYYLKEAVLQLNDSNDTEIPKLGITNNNTSTYPQDTQLLGEQLQQILKTSADIYKVSEKL
ncbi:MAG: FUSC family protein [Sphingobacteriales bacterium]|nr:MAG: FUSC family protein [Sphingobacteriales bacterium]TAF83897.1 MAG: FUSC family protein [Sphingobacteriales bacterium]